MSFACYKQWIEEGDTVFVYMSPQQIKPVVIKSGTNLNNKHGEFAHSDMVGKPYGFRMVCKR